jgi:hypothetical protein
MFIGVRRARQLLTRDGVSAWSAQRVLESGLVGEPIRSGSALLYDEARVTELAERPSTPWRELGQRCPEGVFVSRRAFPATGSRAEQVAALSSGWSSVSPWRLVAMSHWIQGHGYFPFVATIGGLVVLGADIVQVRGLSELTLAPPGSWFDVTAGHWLPTGPGRPWALYPGPPIAAGELSPDAA